MVRRPKTVLITGASSGLGLAYAKILDRAGVNVLSGSRQHCPIGEHVYLDLADLASIQSFAQAISRRDIDCVVNNAGVLNPKINNVHGTEAQMGVNFLGHFALTKHLLDVLPTTTRFVHVTSMVSRFTSITPAKLSRLNHVRPLHAYAMSKLAVLMFAIELAERDPERLHIACHPGYTATNILTNLRLGKIGNAVLGQKAEDGVKALVMAAEEDILSGTLVGPKSLFELRGEPETLPIYPSASDRTARQQLWSFAEQQLSLQFNL